MKNTIENNNNNNQDQNASLSIFSSGGINSNTGAGNNTNNVNFNFKSNLNNINININNINNINNVNSNSVCNSRNSHKNSCNNEDDILAYCEKNSENNKSSIDNTSDPKRTIEKNEDNSSINNINKKINNQQIITNSTNNNNTTSHISNFYKSNTNISYRKTSNYQIKNLNELLNNDQISNKHQALSLMLSTKFMDYKKRYDIIISMKHSSQILRNMMTQKKEEIQKKITFLEEKYEEFINENRTQIIAKFKPSGTALQALFFIKENKEKELINMDITNKNNEKAISKVQSFYDFLILFIFDKIKINGRNDNEFVYVNCNNTRSRKQSEYNRFSSIESHNSVKNEEKSV